MSSQLAQQIVEHVGGPANIKSVLHCATRLRFQIVDIDQVDQDAVSNIAGVSGTIFGQGQFQVIIGTEVPFVYDEVVSLPGINAGGMIDGPQATEHQTPVLTSGSPRKLGIIDRILAAISAIFTPYIPLLASVGIIKGLLAIALQLGVLAEQSSTYVILYAAGNAVIYFFPILLAFTAARQFGANPYVGATIGASLLEPSLTAINTTGAELNFLGLPFIGQSFGGTVVPILVSIWIFSYLEKGLKRILPQITHLLLVPVLSLLIMVPATLLIFGPIGFAVANLIASGYNLLVDYPILLHIIFGGFFVYVIMFGVHWIILPIQLSILADQGLEYSLASGGMGNYAILGVLLAVLITARDKPTRTVAGSAAFVNLIAGITEPGIYGVIIKNKRYFGAVTIAGMAGGLVCALFNVFLTAFAFTGVLGAPAFLASPRAVPYFAAVFTTITVAFTLTLIMDKAAQRHALTTTRPATTDQE